MPTTMEKLEKRIFAHPNKREILKKINESTQIITNSTILSLLKKKGAVELSLDELRKRLSTLKTPLSNEIIEGRRMV